jgi:hypothetical protein
MFSTVIFSPSVLNSILLKQNKKNILAFQPGPIPGPGPFTKKEINNAYLNTLEKETIKRIRHRRSRNGNRVIREHWINTRERNITNIREPEPKPFLIPIILCYCLNSQILNLIRTGCINFYVLIFYLLLMVLYLLSSFLNNQLDVSLVIT